MNGEQRMMKREIKKKKKNEKSLKTVKQKK